MPAGALIGGGLSLAGSLGGAFLSSSGAKEAAQTQAQGALQAAQLQYQAAQDSLAFQKQVYGNNQQIYGNLTNNVTNTLSPFINNGTNAMYSLASLYGLPTPNNPGGGASVNSAFDAFTKLPAYQFPLQQGNLALERQLNAQGRTQSGAQARETQQFGQGLASTYMMQNYVNPLMSIAGQGASAAGQLSSVLTSGAGSAMGANNNSAGNVAQINSNMGSQVGGSLGNAATAQASGQLGSANAWAGGLTGGMNNLAMYSALAYGGGGGSGTYSLTGPSWGGGNAFTDAYGGSGKNPLPGLSPSDYGAGF